MRASLRNPSQTAFNGELSRLVNALPTAAYTVGPDGTITTFNDRAVAIWGRCPRPEEKWCGSWKVFTPEGEPLTLECAPMSQTMQTGEPILGHKVQVERPDGTRILIAPFPHPLFDSSHQIAGAVNLMLPLTSESIAEPEHASVARSAERLSRFLLPLAELSRTMSSMRSVDVAASDVMSMMCDTLDAGLGVFWLLDGKLRLRPVACVENKQHRGRYASFMRHTRQCLLSWGADLPGRAAAKWQPIWVDDLSADEEFRRSQMAAGSGLAAAVAYPLIPTGSGPVRGVLELYFEIQSPEHDWVNELLSGASSLLGDFIAQLDLQQAERENRRRTHVDGASFVSAMFNRGGASPAAVSLHRRH